MKRLKKYKELVKAAWRALNEKDLPAYEKKKDDATKNPKKQKREED